MLESPATDPGRAADQTMREEIARALCEADGKNPDAVWMMTMVPPDVLRWREYACKADAILSGPLAPILQEAAQLRARLHEAEKALRPFAKAGELFGPRESDSYDQAVYMPAAGPEYGISGDDLRRARAALTPAPEANQEAGDV